MSVLRDIVLFNLGRGVLLACTAGRYPRHAALDRGADCIVLTGTAVLVVVWIVIALCNQPS